jgi:hypothetical protein
MQTQKLTFGDRSSSQDIKKDYTHLKKCFNSFSKHATQKSRVSTTTKIVLNHNVTSATSKIYQCMYMDTAHVQMCLKFLNVQIKITYMHKLRGIQLNWYNCQKLFTNSDLQQVWWKLTHTDLQQHTLVW